ncbi:uncharacterized protein LOC113233677 [Hyposmocoma kahamanoa]|uniref:uncharacterized protein LOC113233677 n=1 Tax=Hyposmocoma kahamanoa TaxID=1477025 RepID=UPI000E6D824A|nr:uncharacterized protein LOC113233677 [Hyposmocoma kahamanoa]
MLIGSAAALGSGPYLPSGWRPRGPAFLLPSEVEEPAVPLKDVPVQDVEASGSDFLREYGPPKISSQEITQQALPDVETERSFALIEAKFADEADAVTEEVSLNTEEKLLIQVEVETATESDVNEENVVDTEEIVQGHKEESQRSFKVTEEIQEDQENAKEDTENNNEVRTKTSEVTQEINQVTEDNNDVTTEISEVTQISQVTQNNNEATKDSSEATPKTSPVTQENGVVKVTEGIVATKNERVEKKIEEYMKAVDEGVKSITETLTTLENETLQDVSPKSIEATIGPIRAPEGFLEYGPPGFKEYGPPKEDLLRSENIVEEKSSADATQIKSNQKKNQSNETRRRRFSPKFKQIIRRKAQ